MTTIDEIRAEIEQASGGEADRTAESAEQFTHRLFGDRLTWVAEQQLGPSPSGGTQRSLSVVAVDGVNFGWIEDGNPKWGYEFAGWAWQVEERSVTTWVPLDEQWRNE